MHVLRMLHGFGCATVVVSVFVMRLCHDLKTAESRVNNWRW